MTNYEKIKNESVEGIASLIATFEFNNIDDCKKCFRYNTFERWEEAMEWLNEEIIPILSEAERAILENIDKDYKWICKCKSGELIILENKPTKLDNMWMHEGYVKSFNMFNHLFQFITWQDDEPYNIEGLLKN